MCSLKKRADLLKIIELGHSRTHVIEVSRVLDGCFSHSMVAFQCDLEFYLCMISYLNF